MRPAAINPRTRPAPQPARRASSAVEQAPSSRNTCSTRRRAAVSLAWGSADSSMAKPAAVIVQTRRGARGSSASSTLIAIFSTMPGGASV